VKRTTLNFIVDSIVFVDLLLLATTGAIMRWVLPPGSGGGGHGYGFRGGRLSAPDAEQVRQLLGLGRHDWGDIHFILASLFLVLILIHLVLHWTWIKTCAISLLRPSRRRPCGQTVTPEEGP
jgi:Domain of unknown function (DUF4405)